MLLKCEFWLLVPLLSKPSQSLSVHLPVAFIKLVTLFCLLVFIKIFKEGSLIVRIFSVLDITPEVEPSLADGFDFLDALRRIFVRVSMQLASARLEAV